MAEVQGDKCVCCSGPTVDRRRRGALNRSRRVLIALVRSKWIAAFVTAFAVSWGFHVVDERADRKIERQSAILECTIQGMASKQALTDPSERVDMRPILQACEKHEGK